MAQARNPDAQLAAGRVFTPAAPIDSEALFAGRKLQVRQVVDAINQRGQHAIIFGERGVGKTSLSNILPTKLSAPVPIYAPRVNCFSSDTYDSLWRRIFEAIDLKQQARRIGFAPAADAPEQAVATISVQALLPESELKPDDVRRILTVLGETGLLILIIDEFDRIDDSGLKTAFADTLKMLSDHAVRATVVLVGVADTVEDLIDHHQSIERALVQIRMPRMSRAEVEEIILKGLKTLDMAMEAAALRNISLLCQGLPHYTHLLGLYASRESLAAGTRRITKHHVEAAIKKALDGTQQTVQALYHTATMSARKEHLYRHVLLACALAPADELGYFAAADVRAPMSAIMQRDYDIPSFSRHLYDFCEPARGNVLEKTGVARRYRFRFRNPLLQPYVTMRGFADGLLSRETIEQFSTTSADTAPAD